MATAATKHICVEKRREQDNNVSMVSYRPKIRSTTSALSYSSTYLSFRGIGCLRALPGLCCSPSCNFSLSLSCRWEGSCQVLSCFFVLSCWKVCWVSLAFVVEFACFGVLWRSCQKGYRLHSGSTYASIMEWLFPLPALRERMVEKLKHSVNVIVWTLWYSCRIDRKHPCHPCWRLSISVSGSAACWGCFVLCLKEQLQWFES